MANLAYWVELAPKAIIVAVARSKQVCIEWMEATVLFCKDCLEEKRDLYSPASRLAFAGDALARLTRDALPALPALHALHALLALLATPVRPVDDALLAPLG